MRLIVQRLQEISMALVVVEYIAAISVTQARFPADAL